jgi:hypothetical protein
MTLRQAGDFIAKLPQREQDRPESQSAVKDLLRAASAQRPWRFFARFAVMHALYCAFRRSRPWIPSEAGRLNRLKPAGDSDDPADLEKRVLATTLSSGDLAGWSSSF